MGLGLDLENNSESDYDAKINLLSEEPNKDSVSLFFDGSVSRENRYELSNLTRWHSERLKLHVEVIKDVIYHAIMAQPRDEARDKHIRVPGYNINFNDRETNVNYSQGVRKLILNTGPIASGKSQVGILDPNQRYGLDLKSHKENPAILNPDYIKFKLRELSDWKLTDYQVHLEATYLLDIIFDTLVKTKMSYLGVSKTLVELGRFKDYWDFAKNSERELHAVITLGELITQSINVILRVNVDKSIAPFEIFSHKTLVQYLDLDKIINLVLSNSDLIESFRICKFSSEGLLELIRLNKDRNQLEPVSRKGNEFLYDEVQKTKSLKVFDAEMLVCKSVELNEKNIPKLAERFPKRMRNDVVNKLSNYIGLTLEQIINSLSEDPVRPNLPSEF